MLTVPKQLACELADALPGDVSHWPEAVTELGIVKILVNRHTGEERRWTAIHELVIQTSNGAMWRSLYERGLTEYQDTGPFEDEGSYVSFRRVMPKETVVIEYVPFQAPDASFMAG